MYKQPKAILDRALSQLTDDFIVSDPISIAYRFTDLQDIEIAGFFAAIFSWGRRDIIIQKSTALLEIMDHRPYEFVMNYNPKKRSQLEGFKHRTFNELDLDFYLKVFQKHYQSFDTMETMFHSEASTENVGAHIASFYNRVTDSKGLARHRKHISTPINNSACKRLCMYLRWMVRKDTIDLGLWKTISPAQLVVPLDVHVMNIAMQLGLLDTADKPNWKTAVKLTECLKIFDPKDPIKYDLALFFLGVFKKEF